MTTREATVIANAADARRLGRYVLLGEIAEGGMGRIYLARAAGAAGFEKLFALKIMHQGLAERNPDLADMFLDEARINSLVRHPNVCAVHDFGEAEGVRYLVMEYMIGQTLLDVLRRVHQEPAVRADPLFWAYAARIVAEACEGLHAAHTAVDEHGRSMHVIHRDISPENVFMTYHGGVKVFDFGISKATGRRHQTVAGTFKGKFAYASPEAFSSEGLDRRSDLWSMGVVLWELLAGRALFHRGTEAEILGAIFQDEIPRVTRFQPTCPAALQQIIDRALSRPKEGRYASARDFARDLNRFAVSTGEHLGTAEIGEWIRAIFPEEHAAALATHHSIERLDTRQIDLAPKLEGAPPTALISEVVSRNEPPRSLHSEPTVVHGVHSPYLDDDEETALANSPIVDELFGSSPVVPNEVFEAVPDFAERDVSSSSNLGTPSPFADSPGSASGQRQIVGAPSPFEEPPTIERDKKPLVGTPMKVIIAIAALAGGIYLADMATQPAEMAQTEAEPEAGAEPQTQLAETETETGTETETETGTETATGTETETGTDTETGTETGAETGMATETETGTRTETETETGTESDSTRRRSMRSTPTPRMTVMASTMAPREAPPPVGEPGMVSVVAIGGWADIFEGSRRLGRTPARLTLSAGRHTLILLPANGPAQRQTVDVPAGGIARVRVEL
jgi:serine/threonine-protein kinase